MKLTYLCLVVFTTLFLSCGGESTTDEDQKDNSNSLAAVDTVQVDSVEEDNGYLVKAILDGPDEYFYIFSATDDYNDNLEIPEGKELHIIPDVYNSDGNDPSIAEWMVAIASNNFQLNDPYMMFSGPVKVFYNENRSVLAAEFTAKEGFPSGPCTLYTPEGEIYIQRQYELNTGDWLSSAVEPFGANWTFNQQESSLTIRDKQNAFTAEKDKQVVSIMPSNTPGDNFENSLYHVMEKASFNNPFQINGQVFNGILRAYFSPTSLEPELYYELPFTDGWLDGHIMIYNEWGELALHEIFEMGELDSTVYVLEYEDGVAKPIIYLYPETETVVDVHLQFDGKLTHTYPAYDKGWTVTARPDGTLYDENGKEYYALYWEGDNRKEFTIDEGFVVPGNQTAEFLEKSLDALGLNRREANEFIVYWLPLMESNPYNLIHFSTDEYEEMAQLKVQPQPETVIRVMMVYQPLEQPVSVPLQDLSGMKKERKGFTLVEWGGSQVYPPL